MNEDRYKAIMERVRLHARLVVEAAEEIDTREMDAQVFELRELQQELICMEIVGGMTPEQLAEADRKFEEWSNKIGDAQADWANDHLQGDWSINPKHTDEDYISSKVCVGGKCRGYLITKLCPDTGAITHRFEGGFTND